MAERRDLQIAEGLKGMGAWWSGKGPEWENSQTLRAKQEHDQQVEQQAEQARIFAGKNRTVLQLIEAKDMPAAMTSINETLSWANSAGVKPVAFEQMQQLLQAGKYDEAYSIASRLETGAVNEGIIDPETDEDAKSVTGKTTQYGDGSFGALDKSGNAFIVTPTGRFNHGEPGYAEAVAQAVKSGVVNEYNMAAAATQGQKNVELEMNPRITAEVASAEATEQRGQEAINYAVDAAKGLPIIRRAQYLTNLVGTGGWDRAAMSAKQWFGIESADEAEISNLLGKSVLSQLKATFGSQFTEKEGALLQKIEANIGKSKEGNIRILKQLEAMANKWVERGIKMAEARNDWETVDDLMQMRDFNLNTPDTGSTPSINAKGWPLMNDAEGNKAYVGPNGEIEEVR